MPPVRGAPPDLRPPGPDRRDVLRMFSAGAAALVAGCSSPEEEIVPYIGMPEGMVPGRPMFFATTLPLGGVGRGVVVESHEGRPTKVHGNPLHPASLGATDVFAEAAVLDLFDPERPRVPYLGTMPSSWLAFEESLGEAIAPDGRGARLLTGPMASPTLARQIAELLERRPGLRWHAMPGTPGVLDVTLAEAPEARLSAVPDFARARTIVSLGCDFLGAGPDQIATARAFSRARSERPGAVRMHAFEPSPTLTGAKADRRTGAMRGDLAALALWLAGDDAEPGALPEHLRAPALAARRDMEGGEAILLAGPDLPAGAARALARLNERLGGLVAYRARPGAWPGAAPEGLEALAEDMRAGAVSALVILDANPVHEAPATGFAEALAAVPWTAHAGVTVDETAARCRWRLPLAHPLEDWSDLRGPDGTVGLVQPLIAPLHDSRSRHEFMDRLIGGPSSDARAILGRTWSLWRAARGDAPEGPEFEAFWTRALHDGVVEGTAAPLATPDLALAQGAREQSASSRADGAPNSVPPEVGGAPTSVPSQAGSGPDSAEALPTGLGGASGASLSGFELTLRPSPTVWTGDHAGNAWLQECPEPFTKQVWGNALWMAPADATALGLSDGDAVRLATEHGEVQTPVIAVHGQHPGTLALSLGHGRSEAGPIGSGVGVWAAPLLPPGAAATLPATVTPIGSTLPVHRTQRHFEEMGTDIVRTVPAEDLLIPEEPAPATFYRPYLDEPHAWAMVVDLDLCIGCNACVIACQSENNIPVVGPEEVERGRIMHWMRVDAYEQEGSRTAFQPVPCMHCEQAPCEPVCPVAASVHDHQGLNVQVYNRCVGTRFCQANCPYKVRRFNFFDYAGTQAYENQGADLLAALRNPDVSVRARGVMEKCTYCVQRIQEARIEAAREGRDVAEGAVRTACQNACPAEAIVFGDLNHANAPVSKAKRDPRHYALLGELGTRPRTTYLARVENRGEKDDA